MPSVPCQPLRIESQNDDRVIVLGCESCDSTVKVSTGDGIFQAVVQDFFVQHARCAASIDLA